MDINNTVGISTNIRVKSKKLEKVCSFKFLESTVEVFPTIMQTTTALTKLKHMWNDISLLSNQVNRLGHLHLSTCMLDLLSESRLVQVNTLFEDGWRKGGE